jgi:hypothetical protein
MRNKLMVLIIQFGEEQKKREERKREVVYSVLPCSPRTEKRGGKDAKLPYLRS